MKQSTITPRQKTRRISTHPLNTSSSIRPISPPLGTHPRSISAKSLSQNRLPRLSACSLSDKHQEKATDLATIEQCTHTHPHHVCKHKPQTTQHPRTWDRLSLHARQKEARTFNEESDDFTEPLPHNAPHPRILTQKIITTTFEILSGHRSPMQLRHWFTADVYGVLQRRAALAMRTQGKRDIRLKTRFKNIHISYIRPRIAEITAIVHDGLRLRAIALRMEFSRSTWKVTALDIG